MRQAVKIKTRFDRKWLIVRATSKVWGADREDGAQEAKDYYDRLFATTEVGPDRRRDGRNTALSVVAAHDPHYQGLGYGRTDQ